MGLKLQENQWVSQKTDVSTLVIVILGNNLFVGQLQLWVVLNLKSCYHHYYE